MSVLVDTSVWIEFFHRRPSFDLHTLTTLIEERQVVTCLPVMAELLSGEMTPPVRIAVHQAFDAMTCVDPDWNLPETWRQLIELAIEARKMKVGITGVVDRMILLAARGSGAQLWTLDKKILKLASATDVNLFG